MLGKRFYFLVLLVLGVTILVSSCTTENKEEATRKAVSLEEEQSSLLDTVTIVLKSNDKMQFDLDEIVVYDGQMIRLTLEHTGALPKSSMGHNFVLLNNSISVSEYAAKAMKAGPGEYIPKDSELTIAHTNMIGGGEKTEITFKAPPVGRYDFICSFPGHYSNMRGIFIVNK